MENLIPILILTIGLSTLINLALKRFNMPTVIGYIVTGAIVRVFFDIDLHDNESLEKIAEFGIVFLMFTIGLEFSVAHLKLMKREVFFFGALQVFFTSAIIVLITHLIIDIDIKTSIIVASGLALSSTAIVLKLLNEAGKIKTQVGRNSVGILIFQDIAVIPILLMITIFSDTQKSLSELLITTSINAIIALVILVIIGKYVFHYLFKAVSSANSKEIYMGSILMTVISASYIAHYFGFSYSLGGFIAGMMIAETIYRYQVEADLIPFRDILLGVFFVTVGLQIDVHLVMNHIFTIILLSIGIMVLKAASIFTILIFTNEKKIALKSAITLAQVGEFSLVVFSLLSANHMMDKVSVEILMVVTIISMLTAPFLINHSESIVKLLFKKNIQEKAMDQASIIGGHVILCGYDAFGRVVSERLDKAGINHIILTNNTEAFVKASEAGKTVIFGDPADRTLLEKVKIRDAMSTILALEDYEEIKKVSASITLIDPEIKVIAKVMNEEEMQELAEFNHELLLDGNSYSASFLVDQINKSRLLAKETLKLQHLSDYSLDDPDEAISKVEREQVRLLDITSKSFNALREEKDVMHIKAFHDSFMVLSEIIGDAILNIMKKADLSSKQYGRICILLDNQGQLIGMNHVLEGLGKELNTLVKYDDTRKSLSHIAVEGLDAILLILIDLANQYDEYDAHMINLMTSGKGSGLAKIRDSYLAAERSELDANAKAILISVTNRIERLRSLLGMIGGNYKKLTEAI